MIESYLLGPRETVCGECEILTYLLLPKPKPSTGMSYQKFMLRGANALAVAGVAAMLRLAGDGDGTIAESRIVLTAVAPKPVMAEAASAHLLRKRPSEALFAETSTIAIQAAKPITDIRGTAEYRSQLIEILTDRALKAALSRAQEKGDRLE
jgi:carbon-monoxide dehydrogenase medium subunit